MVDMRSVFVFLFLGFLMTACEPGVSPGPQEHPDDERAIRIQRYSEQLAVLEDAKIRQQALLRLVGVVSAIPDHLRDGKGVSVQEVVQIHQAVQASIRHAEGQRYHWLLEREAAYHMLRSILLPAGEAAPDSLLARYAGALVQNMSVEYPTVLAALEQIRDSARRAEIAREALLNLDVLEAMATEQRETFEAYLQASASLPAKATDDLHRVREEVEQVWPPRVETGRHLVPLNVGETRARLHAMIGL